jgi:hypothetical protein
MEGGSMTVSESEGFVGDFLQHFGVKGMRWGRRKDDGGGGSHGHKTEISEDAEQAEHLSAKAKAGGTKALSNKELRALVDRMGLEKRFKEINTPAAKKKNPILAGVVWTTKKAATLTGQSMEQVIKTNLANEMNARVKTQLAGAAAKKA